MQSEQDDATTDRYTPRAWRIAPIENSFNYRIFNDLGMPVADVLATVEGQYPFDANARAIAASPDLLIAARRLLTEIHKMTTGVESLYFAYHHLEAAVHKAEGR